MSVTLPDPETHPAAALVAALRGRTVLDATCDGEGNDDVWLRLDNGSVVRIDAIVETATPVQPVDGGEPLELGPHGRLIVAFPDRYLLDEGPAVPGHCGHRLRDSP